MNPTAGQMIIAGDLARVMWWFEHAGRGARGWAYAEEQLRNLHPGSQTNSINAVMRIARETAAIGNRYRQGNPNYFPPVSAIPDARPLEADLPPAPGAPGGRRRSEFVHEGVVTITDPDREGREVQMFNVTIRSSDPLTRSEFERMMAEQGNRLYDQFLNYLDERAGEYRLQVTFRLEGVYRSF